jgi:hypothetical protein
MGDPNRMWTAQLRADQNEALEEMVEEQNLNKSEALKRCVDTHLNQQNGTDLTNYEDAALDAAVFSAIGTIAATAAAAFGLVAWAPGLQLAGVLAATAVASVLIVQQGVLRSDE